MLRVLMRVALIPTVLVLTAVIGFLAFEPSAKAAINPQINFQGKLTNPDGTNVTNGNYSIVFSMYTVAVGGSAVWTETQNVSISDGVFQVYLGSVTSLPGSVDFNNASIYLGVKVGADPEMSPRVRFTSSPYAFNSDKLNGLDSTGFVQLAQGLQSDSSTTNASVAINKTGTTAKIVDIQRNGATVFNINNDGSVLFKNQADSATAFDVQDSAGLSLLTIDTTNDRLYVGDSTADGLGVLLVLDSKNTSGDPSGVNGGMYYNSFDNKSRCYENGVWSDCSTLRLAGETTLAAANATISITLNDNYEYLECRIDSKSRSAASIPYVRFNNDTGAAAYGWNAYGIVAAAVTDWQDASDSEIQLSGTQTGTNPFSADLKITNFANTNKVVDWTAAGVEAVGTNSNRYSGVGGYYNTASQITSVQFVTSAGTFSAASHAWCQGRNIR